MRPENAMITFITLLIFTGAFAAAAEYAWWAPQRRTRQEIEQRLRGLRVATTGQRQFSFAPGTDAVVAGMD